MRGLTLALFLFAVAGCTGSNGGVLTPNPMPDLGAAADLAASGNMTTGPDMQSGICGQLGQACPDLAMGGGGGGGGGGTDMSSGGAVLGGPCGSGAKCASNQVCVASNQGPVTYEQCENVSDPCQNDRTCSCFQSYSSPVECHGNPMCSIDNAGIVHCPR